MRVSVDLNQSGLMVANARPSVRTLSTESLSGYDSGLIPTVYPAQSGTQYRIDNGLRSVRRYTPFKPDTMFSYIGPMAGPPGRYISNPLAPIQMAFDAPIIVNKKGK